MALECKSISFNYGIKPVLEDISINFGKGHLYGIIGPNGSGKSSLFDAFHHCYKLNAGFGYGGDEAYYVKEKAENFVDWFLSKTVQEYIPENNWMFPANQYAELPDSFQYAVNLTGVNLLNDLIPSEELQEHLGTWMNSWLEAIYIPGFEAVSVVFVFSFLGAIVLVITRRNKKYAFK